MIFKLQTYGHDERAQGEPTKLHGFNLAVDTGRHMIDVGRSLCFHVWCEDEDGQQLRLPNGRMLYVGRWSDRPLNRR